MSHPLFLLALSIIIKTQLWLWFSTKLKGQMSLILIGFSLRIKHIYMSHLLCHLWCLSHRNPQSLLPFLLLVLPGNPLHPDTHRAEKKWNKILQPYDFSPLWKTVEFCKWNGNMTQFFHPFCMLLYPSLQQNACLGHEVFIFLVVFCN